MELHPWPAQEGWIRMYEHHKQPLLSIQEFFVRMLRHGLLSLVLLIISLGIGILGYHFLEELAWLDALVNASMILGGMGPVNPLHTTAGKFFASFYALYSGMIFLIMAGVMLAPVVHRFLHHFHLMETQT
jgi:hypothetical protein